MLDVPIPGEKQEDDRIYKISYTLNLLPSIKCCDDAPSLMAICNEMTEPEELDIFNSKTLLDFVDYKWNTYGYKIHYIGVAAHIFYLLTVTIYIYTTYLHGTYGEK